MREQQPRRPLLHEQVNRVGLALLLDAGEQLHEGTDKRRRGPRVGALEMLRQCPRSGPADIVDAACMVDLCEEPCDRRGHRLALGDGERGIAPDARSQAPDVPFGDPEGLA